MKLTENDIDILSVMFIVFMHSAERCIIILEQYFESVYRLSKDYDILKKKYGKPKADEFIKKQAQKIVRGDEKNAISEILEAAKKFKKHMDKLTINAINSHTDDATPISAFDDLLHDSNFMARLYAIMINCQDKDDEIKIESSIRALAKANVCPDYIIDSFR